MFPVVICVAAFCAGAAFSVCVLCGAMFSVAASSFGGGVFVEGGGGGGVLFGGGVFVEGAEAESEAEFFSEAEFSLKAEAEAEFLLCAVFSGLSLLPVAVVHRGEAGHCPECCPRDRRGDRTTSGHVLITIERILTGQVGQG